MALYTVGSGAGAKAGTGCSTYWCCAGVGSDESDLKIEYAIAAPAAAPRRVPTTALAPFTESLGCGTGCCWS